MSVDHTAPLAFSDRSSVAGTPRRVGLDLVFGIVAAVLIGLALFRLTAATDGLVTREVTVGSTPATVWSAGGAPKGPAVVVAHGFAGSRPLMREIAANLARAGYVAVTFDFLGHGRNPEPLTGSIVEVEGATRRLVDQTAAVVTAAKTLPEADGRVAILGHSMASDIVIRVARADPAVAATVAWSMFSREITPREPRNLLVVVGAYEARLAEEARGALALAVPDPSLPGATDPGRTHGDPAAGTGRRWAASPGVEHVGILYAEATSRETIAWLDASFAVARPAPVPIGGQGPWILALLLGIGLAARPLARALPVVADPPAGAGLGWRRLWPVIVVPPVAVPLALTVLPTHFLPVLVADYLAVHFGLYGLTVAALTAFAGRDLPRPAPVRPGPLLVAVLGTALLAVGAGLAALDTYVATVVPGPDRALLTGAMLVGTLLYFLADEWATRGLGAPRGAQVASRAAFLVSLGFAVALQFERLFFLALIIPVILAFFLVTGWISRQAVARTGHPAVGAVPTAILFALAVSAVFPMLGG